MPDPLEKFVSLALRARGAAAPPVDVAAGVLEALRVRRAAEPVDRTMLVFSGFALAATLLLAVWGLDAWSTLSDPLAGLFQPISVVMQ